VALAHIVTAERTAELARRLFRSTQAGARIGAPRLVVLTGPNTGHSVDVPEPPSRLLIGRAEHCQLVLADPGVEDEHVEVVRDLDGVLVHKLVPASALRINEQSVAQRRLRDADELVLGATRLLFEEPAEEPMDGLLEEADRALPATAAPPAVDVAATPTPADAQPDSSGDSARPQRRPRPPFDADVIIYTLAAIVIAISAAGLIALMSAQ
jgi:predicted component of type VI protein secretion system